MMLGTTNLPGLMPGTCALLGMTMAAAGAADAPAAPVGSPADAARLQAVRQFADNVLAHGRDGYGPRPTPLFVDGINVTTHAPVEWVHQGQRWIVSNLASQQTLFRTFTALSRLSGEPQYRQAAEAATSYHLQHLRRPCGLLQWGGHRFIDLRTGKVVGEQDSHELKSSYPYYDLLRDVDPDAAAQVIRAMWNAHVLDWRVLDMNRHGIYNRPMGSLWESPFTGGEPFFEGKGLTFINCGSDLVYAGGLLHAYTGEAGALLWAGRLADQYARARDPRTGLGAYQFSQAIQSRAPTDDRNTSSAFGDRAKRQFGPEFGDRALEGRMLTPGHANAIYGSATLAMFRLAERLGDAGKPFLDWGRSGLLACAAHAYDRDTNRLIPMFTDGTPIRPEDVKRPGYYSRSGFEPQPPGPALFVSFVAGYRLTGEPVFWRTARAMAAGLGLGEIGQSPGEGVQTAADTPCNNPAVLFGVLEIMRCAPAPAYTHLARRIGDNILATRFHHGFFLPSAEHLNACFDALEPFALLALEAHLRGTPEAVPEYVGGRGYIHGPHDGLGRTYDSRAIWAVTRRP